MTTSNDSGFSAPQQSGSPHGDTGDFGLRSDAFEVAPQAFVNNVMGAKLSNLPNGTVLQNRYKVEGVLGQGGFGAVYRVEDLHLPGKKWALKHLVFNDSSQMEAARRSFEREARILSTLGHESLPAIVDYFSQEEGYFLLMEEIEGSTLTKIVERESPIAEGRALRWGIEIARVLCYLHGQNPPVIYRDLKPDNVMINVSGRVKLIDFGLARFFNPSKVRDTLLVGSLGYSAPEIWEDTAQTDARTDVYSFGATMYYMLTGKAPSPVYGTHSIEQYRNDISAEFSRIVLKCMEVKPEDRYASAELLLQDLMALAAGTADDSLKAELREESFISEARASVRQAEEVVPVPVSASLLSKQQKVIGASSTPKWMPLVLIFTTILFLGGCLWGVWDLHNNPSVTYDIPYELVNGDKEEARTYIKNGEFSRAASALDMATTRHPSDAEAHILRENVDVLMNGGEYWRVPAFMSLNGVDAPEAYRLLYGIGMAQYEFNKAAVQGKRVVIDIYDDESNQDKAFQIADEIIADPDYLGIIGPFSSQRTLLISARLNSAGMPCLAPVVSVPEVWDKKPYVFSASDTNLPRVADQVRYLRSKGLSKAALVVDRDSRLSAAVGRYFREQFANAGGDVVAVEEFSGLKFNKAIQAIDASGADVVFFSDHRGVVLAHFAKALRASGSQIPIAGQVGPFTKDLVAVGGRDVEGVLLAGYFHNESTEEQSALYCKKFRAMFGEVVPSHLDASAYDAASIVFAALKAGVKNRQEMCQYLASIGADKQSDPQARPIYTGATGRFALARKMDMRDVYLIEIRDGQYKLVQVDKYKGPAGQ